MTNDVDAEQVPSTSNQSCMQKQSDEWPDDLSLDPFEDDCLPEILPKSDRPFMVKEAVNEFKVKSYKFKPIAKMEGKQNAFRNNQHASCKALSDDAKTTQNSCQQLSLSNRKATVAVSPFSASSVYGSTSMTGVGNSISGLAQESKPPLKQRKISHWFHESTIVDKCNPDELSDAEFYLAITENEKFIQGVDGPKNPSFRGKSACEIFQSNPSAETTQCKFEEYT